jgi:hypothetical protein
MFRGRVGCNGPSLVAAPKWLPGDYSHLLYYAHHHAHEIRALGSRGGPTGPWIDLGVVLRLEGERRPSRQRHFGSPHVSIDEERRLLEMVYHVGPCTFKLRDGAECDQCSRVALSADGLQFAPERGSAPIGCFYLTPFTLAPAHAGYRSHAREGEGELEMFQYALMKRNNDGIVLSRRRLDTEHGTRLGPSGAFEDGKLLLPCARHGVVLSDDALPWPMVIWSNIAQCDACASQPREALPTWSGEAGERLMMAPLLPGEWPSGWTVGQPTELLLPTAAHEGGLLPPTRSAAGQALGPERGLRDPSVLVVRGGEWLLAYSAMGESGIALASLHLRRQPLRRLLRHQRTRAPGTVSEPSSTSARTAALPVVSLDSSEWQPPRLLAPELMQPMPRGQGAWTARANRSRMRALRARGTPLAVAGVDGACDCLVRSSRYAPECGQRGMGPGPPRALLITATGRSGTSFVQRAMAAAGVTMQHDSAICTISTGQQSCVLPESGAVSWPQAFAVRSCASPSWTWRRRLLKEMAAAKHDTRRFKVVIQLVREPLQSIASRYSNGDWTRHKYDGSKYANCVTDMLDFPNAHAGDKASSLRSALRYWVLWHAFLEASAQARMRVEDMDAQRIHTLALLAAGPSAPALPPADIGERLQQLGTRTNHEHTKHTRVEWSMLRDSDPVHYAMALLMAVRYGYEGTLPEEAAADAAALEGVAFQRCGFVSNGRWTCWLSPQPGA